MDDLDHSAFNLHDSFVHGAGHDALLPGSDGLTQSLAVAHTAQGMDPLAAGLQAQFDAALLRPFLG